MHIRGYSEGTHTLCPSGWVVSWQSFTCVDSIPDTFCQNQGILTGIADQPSPL